MTTADRHDHWGAGQPYEAYMGRWSRLIAAQFLDWLDPAPGLRWLDMGCGTGALSDTILARAQPASIRAVDASEAFLQYARAHTTDPRVSFHVGNATDEPDAPGSVDIAASALMLNFVPEPAMALRALRHAVVPGGTLAFYVWDYPGRMDLLRCFWDSAVALKPEARIHDEALRFSWCRRDPLVDVCAQAGWGDVTATPLDAVRRFATFADVWEPLLGGQGPVPRYVSQLADEDRSALHDELRRRLPIQPDGTFELVARAWAVRAIC